MSTETLSRLEEFRTKFLLSSVLNNPFVPQKPTAKQAKFLLDITGEAMYGGSAGGGKSSALLMAALQFMEVPGYAAIIFRRTFTDLALPGALMDRAFTWLTDKAHWDGTKKRWTFPSGATLSFGYLETDQDRYRYASAEFNFCVGRGTLILMADGSYCAIELVRVGDMVATLEGPRTVTRTHPPKFKPSYRLDIGGSSLIVSEDHKILTDAGWASPLEQKPIGYHANGSIHEGLMSWFPSFGMLRESKSADRQQALGPRERMLREIRFRESGVSLVSDRSGFGGFDDSRQEQLQPREWSCRAMLLARECHQDRQGIVPGSRLYARVHESFALESRDLLSDCHGEYDLRDEQFLQTEGVAQERIPSQGDAESKRRKRARVGGQGNTREHSQPGLCTYSHPYTMAQAVSLEAVRPASVQMAPVGGREVYDLTIGSASHYISFGGIISQNCGFDELTQFTETQYRFLFSRLRRLQSSNIPTRMRAASNPGGVGHEWVKNRFIGKTTFYPASLIDNPHLDRDEYTASLQHLDPLTRDQLLRGDWDAFAGGRFKRDWIARTRYIKKPDYWHFGDHAFAEHEIKERFLTVDNAGTVAKTAKDDPDYTVISAWGLTPIRPQMAPVLAWLGCFRLRCEIPDIPPAVAIQYAKWRCGRAHIESGSMQKGVYQLCKKHPSGMNCLEFMPTKDALDRASSILNMAEAGRLWLPANDPSFPMEEVESELYRFTGDPKQQGHDDIFSTASMAGQVVSGKERTPKHISMGGALKAGAR